MRETTRLVPIRAFQDDDGKPFCGECFIPYPCGFYKDVPITKGTVPNEPGPLCPVWHGDSKDAIPAILFDGFAVYEELTIEQRKHIPHRVLSDVLDAIVRLIRRSKEVSE